MDLFNPDSRLASAAIGLPVATRMSSEIKKPKDPLAFQRYCVVLFGAHLRDPHAQEYGRNGQDQRGVDILLRRDGKTNDRVGVQCRLITKPLNLKKMLTDCRAALTFDDGLSEIVFATTAPDDTHATDAANSVERLLAAEGHNLRVVLYGWGQLQNLIARYDSAYALFCPSSVSTLQLQSASNVIDVDALSAAISARMSTAALNSSGLIVPGAPILPEGAREEDPGLHGRIDVLRDLFSQDKQPRTAETRFLALLQVDGINTKPWARFRIHSNLGAIALITGRENDAISHYETAFSIRPGNSSAKANLALARIFQGRHKEAMSMAQEALSGTPRADQALGYLLQAAARSDWKGNPEDLVPYDLTGSIFADLGLAEFYRRREAEGWQHRSIEIGRRHPSIPEFAPIVAVAVLSLAIDSEAVLAGGVGPVTASDMSEAADGMIGYVDDMLAVNFADEHDRVAHVSNTCLLLRLCGRTDEAEKLLIKAGSIVRDDARLRRLMALVLTSRGRQEDAIMWLDRDPDPENRILLADLIASDNPAEAINQAISVSVDGLPSYVARNRWLSIGEMSLKLRRRVELQSAVEGLRSLDASDPAATVFELRGMRQEGLPVEEHQEQLREVAHHLAANTDMTTRYLVASELQENGLPEEASKLLDGRVDLQRVTQTSILYLTCLAEARRDRTFLLAIEQSAVVLRVHPAVLWVSAIHAWNMGDLEAALVAVGRIIDLRPENLSARVLRLEILLRQDCSSEILAELDQPLEQFTSDSLRARCRLTTLLSVFGYSSRASAYAYRLFLENRDDPLAWMTVARLIFNDRNAVDRDVWTAPVVTTDVAVTVQWDDGCTSSFVVEPDPDLRRLNENSLEPDHPLVRALSGLAKDDEFADAAGRVGRIVDIRHKFVAQFHAILESYEFRFPGHNGFRNIKMDPGEPGGLDEIKALLKDRKDWFDQERERYVAGPWPLSLTASRLGLDTIDTMTGLSAEGVALKVSLGNKEELEKALSAIRLNNRSGCVLDLCSFWQAWRLELLDSIITTCGPIYTTQAVLDTLRARRKRFSDGRGGEQRSASYHSGSILLVETSADTLIAALDDVDRAIHWLGENARVCPVIATDDLPDALREQLRDDKSSMWDDLVVAKQMQLLFISDDLFLRQFGNMLGHDRTCWTHTVLQEAFRKGTIDKSSFVRSTSALVDTGHNFIGVTGAVLAQALRMDVKACGSLGPLFRTLCGTIGGKSAEPVSHTGSVMGFMLEAWNDNELAPYWRSGTSMLLTQLLRSRHHDYGDILRLVLGTFRRHSGIRDFVNAWAKGHFISEHAIWGKPEKHRDRRTSETRARR